METAPPLFLQNRLPARPVPSTNGRRCGWADGTGGTLSGCYYSYYTLCLRRCRSLFSFYKTIKDLKITFFIFCTKVRHHAALPSPVPRRKGTVLSFIIPRLCPPAALTSTPLPLSRRGWGIKPNLLHFKLTRRLYTVPPRSATEIVYIYLFRQCCFFFFFRPYLLE